MCAIVAEVVKILGCESRNKGSNPAETIFFVVVDMSTHSTNVEYRCFSKFVAIVATIFS